MRDVLKQKYALSTFKNLIKLFQERNAIILNKINLNVEAIKRLVRTGRFIRYAQSQETENRHVYIFCVRILFPLFI